MLKNGDGIEKNEEQSLDYLKKAADNGHSEAMNEYAVTLEANIKNPEDSLELVAYFTEAIEKNNFNAMYNYAIYLSKYDSKGLNKEKISNYLKSAADNGHSNAMFEYAKIMYRDNNKKEAINYLQKAINLDNSNAMYTYAIMLKNGDIIEKNEEQSLNYLKKAADLGNDNAINYIKNNNLENDMEALSSPDASAIHSSSDNFDLNIIDQKEQLENINKANKGIDSNFNKNDYLLNNSSPSNSPYSSASIDIINETKTPNLVI